MFSTHIYKLILELRSEPPGVATVLPGAAAAGPGLVRRRHRADSLLALRHRPRRIRARLHRAVAGGARLVLEKVPSEGS